MFWRLEYEGEVYREADLTLNQIAKIERLLDYRSWLHIHPARFAGDGIAVLAVMHSAKSGVPVEDLMVKIGELSPSDYLSILHFDEEDDLPVEYRDGFPPPADEPSTST